jgi:hypothetical protein
VLLRYLPNSRWVIRNLLLLRRLEPMMLYESANIKRRLHGYVVDRCHPTVTAAIQVRGMPVLCTVTPLSESGNGSEAYIWQRMEKN